MRAKNQQEQKQLFQAGVACSFKQWILWRAIIWDILCLFSRTNVHVYGLQFLPAETGVVEGRVCNQTLSWKAGGSIKI